MIAFRDSYFFPSMIYVTAVYLKKKKKKKKQHIFGENNFIYFQISKQINIREYLSIITSKLICISR